MQARDILPREQIVCIIDTCNNERLDCVDLTFDESFSSNLYNFLLTEMQNNTSQHQEEKQLFTQTLKILVAEDYDINRMLIESLLEKHTNIDFEFAYDREETVKKATSSHYDMIFMDVNMPKINGLDAIKIIREKLTHHIPVIALTTNALKGDKERFLAAGMDDYIAKPIKAAELDNIILKYTPSQNTAAKDTKTEQKKNLTLQSYCKKNKTRLELDETVIIKLLTAFVQNIEASLTALKEAIKENDTQRILDTAHKIKGSAATLSLDKISTFMQETENNIQNNIEIRYNDIFLTINDYITSLKDSTFQY